MNGLRRSLSSLSAPVRRRPSRRRPALQERAPAGGSAPAQGDASAEWLQWESTQSDEAIAAFLTERERLRARLSLTDGAALLAHGSTESTESDEAIAAVLAERERLRARLALTRSAALPAHDSTENDAAIAALLAAEQDLPGHGGESRTAAGGPTVHQQPCPPEPSERVAGQGGRLPPEPSEPATVQGGNEADDAAIAACLAEEFQALRLGPARRQCAAHSVQQDQEQQNVCIACMDHVANACFIPCGHVNVCCACAGKLKPKRCPVCRIAFEEYVKTQPRRPR